jgi:hypothetical protein
LPYPSEPEHGIGEHADDLAQERRIEGQQVSIPAKPAESWPQVR